MIKVYCAGPISSNPKVNALIALEYADDLMNEGYAPFVPHLSVFWQEGGSKHEYEKWMAYDFAFLSVCDALLRIPGHSPGADREVQFADEHFIPVFYSIHQLTEYYKEPVKCAECGEVHDARRGK